MKEHKNVATREKGGFSTRAIHAGQTPSPHYAAVVTPIYQTSTYVQSSPGVYPEDYDYARVQNPTRTALEKNIASLEDGCDSAAYSSGCAAVASVLQLLSSGDHVLCVDDVYGGTYRLFEQIMKKHGLDFSYVDFTDTKNVVSGIRENTRVLWIETPTNPLLKIVDIESVVKIAAAKNILVVVDSTFGSPYIQRPLNLGADMVLHSSTKYLGGHSDLIGGIIAVRDPELGKKLHYLQRCVGAIPAPFECFLMLRSTKTLAVRMKQHCENALAVAEFLASRKDIERVLYPFLPSHPQFELAKRQMCAGGGMISVVVTGGMERTRKFLESVKVFTLAESLGGVESLISHPVTMTHGAVPKDIREKRGLVDGLVRLSCGIEDVSDLIEDLRQALDASV